MVSSDAILLLQAALDYARRGWRVFPLHTPTLDPERPCSCGRPTCDNPGKHPRITNWPDKATTEPDQIRAWWGMWPESNVGIACGKESGIWVLDVDGFDGERTLLNMEGEHGEELLTVEQITGSGGRHLLFRYEPNLKNAVRFAKGLDLRTDGGLIVAPPSLHATGNRYQWEPSSHPDDIPITPAPAWLVEMIPKQGASRNGHDPSSGPSIPKGQRQNTLWSNACAMQRRGMGEAVILAAIREQNKQCVPPLDDDALTDIAHRAAQYEPAPAAETTERQKSTATPQIDIYTLAALEHQEIADPKIIVPELVFEGFNLYAGRFKSGKSFFVLNLAAAIAMGGVALGVWPVTGGSVLYLALEDTPRRLKKRAKIQLHGAPWPVNLHVAHRWPLIGQGCRRALIKWLSEHPDTRLIIIDTLKKIRPIRAGSRSGYDEDYDFISDLKEIADDHAIGMLGLTHTRKAEAEDVFDTINATQGLGASADTIVVWERKRGTPFVKLSITGRDVEEEKVEDTALVLKWSNEIASWKYAGIAKEVLVSDERREIADCLREAKQPMGPADIAKVIKKDAGAVRFLLFKMLSAEEVEKVSYGRYQLPSVSDPSTNTDPEKERKNYFEH